MCRPALAPPSPNTSKHLPSPPLSGKLNVEITDCLGSGCNSGDGRGNLGSVVRDVVRLVE